MQEEKVETARAASLLGDDTTIPISGDADSSDDKADVAGKTRPERLASFADYLRVFKYANKWDFLAYAAGFLASIGAGVTFPLLNIVFGSFVTQFSTFTDPSQGSEEQLKDTIDQLALYLLGIFIARVGLSYISKFAFRMIGIRLSSAVRLHYLQRLFGQSIHVLDSMPSGYATTTITSTSNILQLGISEKLGVFVEFMSLIIASVIVAFTYNWALSLVMCSVILFITISVSLILPFIVKGNARQNKAEAKAGSVASECMASVKMVMACGAEARMSSKYAMFIEEAKKHAQSVSPLIAVQFGVIFFAAFAAFGLAFWYGTKRYLEGGLNNIGDITIVLMSIMMVVFSLERISNPIMAVGKATIAACQFFTVIDAPQPPKGHLKDPEVSAGEDIIFENVTFAYPSRPHVKVLDDLDLRIEAGKITAIVGPSGSGKSTIVGLIERWYTLQDQYVIAKAVEADKKKKEGKDEEEDEEEKEGDEKTDPADTGPPIKLSGRLTTSGQKLDDIELKWWRSQIGLVQQEPFLFNETIYSNVVHGLVGSPWEDAPEEEKRELVKQACKEAFADEYIDKLPQKYDTLVGDSGAKLSGGQRQRLAIARSIVRKPRILILDEATSAIDVRGEKIVQAALDRVAKNRTTITIAHRLSTIKKADRIVVLKKGKVVESGNHESLIQTEGGVYAALVAAQALSLGEPTEASDEHVEAVDESHAYSDEKGQSGVEEEEITADIKSKKRELSVIIFSFAQLFYETRKYWYLLALTVLFCAGAGAGVPLQAWLFANSINVFQYTSNSKLRSESEFWALMWFVMSIGVGIAYFSGFFTSTRLASFVRAKYQQEYFESILHQKPAFFDGEDHSQGTMTSRISADPQQLEELMGANMASVYVAIFNLIGSVAIAFAFGWKLALVASCVVVPISILAGFWRIRYELRFEKMNNEVFAESSKFASEAIGAFRTVTSLTMEDSITNRFERLLHQHVIDAYKKARWVSLLFGLSDSMTFACQALLFWYGGGLLASGEYTVLSFFVCFMAMMNAGEASGQSLSFGPNAAQVTAAANRILAMRKTRVPEMVSDEKAIVDTKGGMKIEFEDMHFKYPTRDTPVFGGLSFTIEKGQFAALVGASGCGKTSIISLLERFYDLDQGRILCNGKNIADLNVYSYRQHLSLVAQEASLFQGTLRENILLGIDDSAVHDETLYQTCRDASIHDFIISLPEGYNTNIGSRGVTLSGGQKQRVAIARALLRQPDILLLDEATSSLDSESEKLVQAAFERAGKGRTMVVVAHRLATVQNADVIFVLGDGKLLEKGSHAELLKKRGVYWQMCQSQALDR